MDQREDLPKADIPVVKLADRANVVAARPGRHQRKCFASGALAYSLASSGTMADVGDVLLAGAISRVCLFPLDQLKVHWPLLQLVHQNREGGDVQQVAPESDPCADVPPSLSQTLIPAVGRRRQALCGVASVVASDVATTVAGSQYRSLTHGTFLTFDALHRFGGVGAWAASVLGGTIGGAVTMLAAFPLVTYGLRSTCAVPRPASLPSTPAPDGVVGHLRSLYRGYGVAVLGVGVWRGVFMAFAPAMAKLAPRRPSLAFFTLSVVAGLVVAPLTNVQHVMALWDVPASAALDYVAGRDSKRDYTRLGTGVLAVVLMGVVSSSCHARLRHYLRTLIV